MIVYHGSYLVIKYPDTIHSYHALDFGQGFYVTTFKEQAIAWAKRKAIYRGTEVGILNCYEMKVRPRRTFEPLKAAGLSPLWGEQ